MSIKAMVLCAGFGTRLRPLTYKRPKPLLPVLNRPILYHTFDFLYSAGIKDVIINTHYMADYLDKYLKRRPHENINPLISYEQNILGTGGGIKKAEWFFDGTFVVLNGDTYFSMDLLGAINFHLQKRAMVTMLLTESDYAPRVLLNDQDQVISILKENKKGLFTYTGIQILEPQIFDFIEPNTFVDVMDVYRSLVDAGFRRIYGLVTPFVYWKDLGKIVDYVEVNRDLIVQTKDQGGFHKKQNKSVLIAGNNVHLEEQVFIEDWAIIGNGTTIKKGARIARSILWEDILVDSGANVVDSIVTDREIVAEDLYSATR